MKIIRNIFIGVIIIVLLFAFSSSYTSLSIDNLAFVISIAVDKGTKSNSLQVSFQFTKPSSISQPGSVENSTSIINTVETTSIASAINLMNSYIGKEVNFSHCKLIVFSEELAIDGISDHIYALMNNAQVRPYTNIVISKTNAKYYVENSKPSLEALPTKYYEIFPNSSKYTGYTVNATIGDFFNSLKCNTGDSYAILGGIIDTNLDNPEEYSSIDPLNSGDIKSNETSISGERGAENIGLAVFNSDKLVGELNAIETICFSIIENEVNGFLITVQDPQSSENYIDIYLYHDHETKIKIDIINGTPYITIDCEFDGRIYSMKSNSEYLDNNILNQISEYASNFIQLQMYNYLYKTSKQFNADINHFGVSALSKFTTVDEYEKFDWLNNYQNSFFTVNTDVIIKSGSLLVET